MEKVLKKFKCPDCGTIHIVDSSLNVEHSFYEENKKEAEKILSDKGIEPGKEEGRKQDTGKEDSQKFEKKVEEEKEKKENEENKEEDNGFNWGGWK